MAMLKSLAKILNPDAILSKRLVILISGEIAERIDSREMSMLDVEALFQARHPAATLACEALLRGLDDETTEYLDVLQKYVNHPSLAVRSKIIAYLSVAGQQSTTFIGECLKKLESGNRIEREICRIGLSNFCPLLESNAVLDLLASSAKSVFEERKIDQHLSGIRRFVGPYVPDSPTQCYESDLICLSYTFSGTSRQLLRCQLMSISVSRDICDEIRYLGSVNNEEFRLDKELLAGRHNKC